MNKMNEFLTDCPLLIIIIIINTAHDIPSTQHTHIIHTNVTHSHKFESTGESSWPRIQVILFGSEILNHFKRSSIEIDDDNDDHDDNDGDN